MYCRMIRQDDVPFMRRGMNGIIGGDILATHNRYTRWFLDGSISISKSIYIFRNFPGNFYKTIVRPTYIQCYVTQSHTYCNVSQLIQQCQQCYRPSNTRRYCYATGPVILGDTAMLLGDTAMLQAQ